MKHGQSSRTKVQSYLRGGSGTLIGLISNAAGGLALIWILNRILTKQEFGLFFLAYVVVQLCSAVASLGLDRLVLYKVSSKEPVNNHVMGRQIVGGALRIGILSGGFLAAVMVVASVPVSHLIAKPGLAPWLIAFSPLIPINVARETYRGWYHGRQRFVQAAVLGQALPMSAIVIGLTLVWLTGKGGIWALAVMVGGPAASFALWFLVQPVNFFDPRSRVSLPDLLISANMMMSSILNRFLTHTDTIMMGALSTAVGTAEYIVGSRLTFVLPIGKQLADTAFIPRIGMLRKNAAKVTEREYDQVRSIGLVWAAIATLLLLFAGRPLLSLFGDYEAAFPVLLLLAAAQLIQIGFGPNGMLLIMSGRPQTTTWVSAVSLALAIGLNILLIPTFGARGAAAATLAGTTCTNCLLAFLIVRQLGLRTVSLALGAGLSVMVVAFLLAAWGILDFRVAIISACWILVLGTGKTAKYYSRWRAERHLSDNDKIGIQD